MPRTRSTQLAGLCFSWARLHAQTSLPSTSVQLAAPKENEDETTLELVRAILQQYREAGIPLTERLRSICWDNTHAGRYATSNMSVVFVRDVRHQLERLRKRKGSAEIKEYVAMKVH